MFLSLNHSLGTHVMTKTPIFFVVMLAATRVVIAAPPAPIDLLDGLNLQIEQKKGNWGHEGGTLVGGGPDVSHIIFRDENAEALAEQDYVVTMEFSVRPDEKGFSDINLTLPSVPASLAIRNEDGDPKASRVYFHHDKQEIKNIARFVPDKRYTATIAVRNNGKQVEVSIDGKLVFARDGFVDQEVEVRPTFEVEVSPNAKVRLFRYEVLPAK